MNFFKFWLYGEKFNFDKLSYFTPPSNKIHHNKSFSVNSLINEHVYEKWGLRITLSMTIDTIIISC